MKEFWFSQMLNIDDQFKIFKMVKAKGKYCYVNYNRDGTPNEHNLEIITKYSESYLDGKKTKFPLESIALYNFDVKYREYDY